MSAARFSLTDEMKAVARGFAPRKDASREVGPSLTQALQKVASRTRRPPTTREGRKGMVLYFDEHVSAAIGRLRSDCGVSNQGLGEMAFKLLFEKFSEPWPAA